MLRTPRMEAIATGRSSSDCLQFSALSSALGGSDGVSLVGLEAASDVSLAFRAFRAFLACFDLQFRSNVPLCPERSTELKPKSRVGGKL